MFESAGEYARLSFVQGIEDIFHSKFNWCTFSVSVNAVSGFATSCQPLDAALENHYFYIFANPVNSQLLKILPVE